jgi:hypothetical protein
MLLGELHSEFRVTWIKLPRNKNETKVVFVSAKNAVEAQAIATDYIERKFGITNFVIEGSKRTERVPDGKVVELEKHTSNRF